MNIRTSIPLKDHGLNRAAKLWRDPSLYRGAWEYNRCIENRTWNYGTELCASIIPELTFVKY